MHKISIIGMGPVGLCTAVCFASKGYKTIISTKNKTKANQVNKGKPPFHEPNLQKLLQKTIKKAQLKAVLTREEAILQTNISFITVGTPSKPNGSINLKFIRQTAKEIGKALKKKKETHLIVVKSTVTPGTTENIVKPLLEKHSNKKCGKHFLLCFNPEFLREGNAIHDTLNPDYIVIGEHNKKAGNMLEALYKDFYKNKLPPIVRTNLPTAELIKYANNAFLATKISFINTIANICEKTPNVDVKTITKAIGLDHRINPHFFEAGLGWGGSCFPKDIKALIAYAKKLHYKPIMLEAVWKANEYQIKNVIQKIKTELGELKGRKIAILGLAFKPNTDDMREARSTKIINQLLKENASIIAYDPLATENAKKILGDKIKYATSVTACLKGADCCILVTEWKEFKRLKPEDFVKHMRKPFLIDGRRIYNPNTFSKKLNYIGIGLGKTPK